MFKLSQILNSLDTDDTVIVKLPKSVIELNKTHVREPLLKSILDKTVDKFETKDSVTTVTIS